MKTFTIEKFPLVAFLLTAKPYLGVMALNATSPAGGPCIHTTDIKDDYQPILMDIGCAVPVRPPSYSVFVKFESKYARRTREFLGFELAGFPKIDWNQRAQTLLQERKRIRAKHLKAKK